MEGRSSPKPVAPPAAADLMDVEPSKLPPPTSNMSLLPVTNGGGSRTPPPTSSKDETKPTPTCFKFAAINQDSNGSAKKSQYASTRRSTIVKIPSQAPPPPQQQQEQSQSPTNEERLSRILCRSLKERMLKRSMEEHPHTAEQEQPAPVAGQPQEPALEMKQPQQQPARELPRRQQPHRAAAVKARTALKAAEKGKAVVMPTASPRPKKKQGATETDAAQALAALSAPRKLELPKIRFELTKEEMEKDFMMMTGGKLPCPKKHPKTVENKIKIITPGAYLPNVNMGRYTVRTRKCKKDKQRKAGLKGMMEDESSNDSN